MAKRGPRPTITADPRTAPLGVSEGVDGAIEFTMDYRDFDGDKCERRVSIDSISVKAGRVILSGYCHLRREPRSFRLDRIESIVTEDGEVLPPQDMRSFIMGLAFEAGVDLDDMERVNGPIRPRRIPDRSAAARPAPPMEAGPAASQNQPSAPTGQPPDGQAPLLLYGPSRWEIALWIAVAIFVAIAFGALLLFVPGASEPPLL